MIKIFTAIIFLMFVTTIPAIGADVTPVYSKNLHTRTYGFYQVGKLITLHENPDENSKIIRTISWTKDKLMPETLSFEDVFTVFNGTKELALMAVEDETEDWVKLIYNSKTNESGWMKKDDPFKFMTWINLYNAYGKKYGLKVLKDTPKELLVLHSQAEDNAQVLARLNYPEFIKLNVIRGNWALVTVVDLDKTPKTGYIRWRSDDGIKYLFPDIK